MVFGKNKRRKLLHSLLFGYFLSSHTFSYGQKADCDQNRKKNPSGKQANCNSNEQCIKPRLKLLNHNGYLLKFNYKIIYSSYQQIYWTYSYFTFYVNICQESLFFTVLQAPLNHHKFHRILLSFLFLYLTFPLF